MWSTKNDKRRKTGKRRAKARLIRHQKNETESPNCTNLNVRAGRFCAAYAGRSAAVYPSDPYTYQSMACAMAVVAVATLVLIPTDKFPEE